MTAKCDKYTKPGAEWAKIVDKEININENMYLGNGIIWV